MEIARTSTLKATNVAFNRVILTILVVIMAHSFPKAETAIRMAITSKAQKGISKLGEFTETNDHIEDSSRSIHDGVEACICLAYD